MTPGASSLLLSDFHAGHHHKRADRKFRALNAMMLRARESNVREIVLAGDIVDERPDRAQVLRECALLRKAIGTQESFFLRGNHDDVAFFNTKEMEKMLQCPIDERPWCVSTVSGVAITHGHHFRMPTVQRALRNASEPKDLEQLQENKRSVRRMRAVNKGFSVAGRVGSSLGKVGIPATDLWEHMHRVSLWSRQKIGVTLRQKKRTAFGGRWWRERVADALDVRSVRHAARLARTMKCWGVVSGHTHVPGLYKYYLKDEETGERIPFLVGNSGGFVSRYAPTCIEVCFPKMILWQYDEREQKLKIRQELSLTPEELALQERVIARPR